MGIGIAAAVLRTYLNDAFQLQLADVHFCAVLLVQLPDLLILGHVLQSQLVLILGPQLVHLCVTSQ